MVYPTVSLFNLDEDPQETNNLAAHHPDMVKDLLAEAEKVVLKAPPQFKGNVMDSAAPKGPDATSLMTLLRTIGTTHSRVIPFGPYLADDQDVSKLDFERGFIYASQPFILYMLVIVMKLFLVVVALPLLVLYKVIKQ